jgi:hypothetical protein
MGHCMQTMGGRLNAYNSPRDMLFEGPRRTMGIFHWPMGVAFEGPSRTMGVLHWPLGVELQSPVIELPKNRTLDRTRTSPCRTAVQSSQNLRAKNRKKPVQKDRSGPVWTGFLHSHTCRVNDTCKWLKKQCLDDFLSQNDKYRLKDCGCFVLAAPQTFVLNP